MTYEQTNESLRKQAIRARRHDEAVARKESQDRIDLLEVLEEMVSLYSPSPTTYGSDVGRNTIDKARAVIEQTKRIAR